MAKLSKVAVHYESPAKGPDQCRGCVHFDPPGRHGRFEYGRCQIVGGNIYPEDWCDRFRRWQPPH